MYLPLALPSTSHCQCLLILSPRLLSRFGGELDLHVLDAFLFVLFFGKIEVTKKFQHALVLTHHQRVEVPNSLIPRFVDQPTGEVYPYPVILPAIFNDGRVLGMFFTRFAIITHDREDLVLIVGIQRDESEVVDTVDLSKVLGLLIGKLIQRTEEAQIDRPLAAASKEPLQ